MDEPTIDCSICGGAGYLEIVVQALDNDANWRTTTRYVACERHIDVLRVSWPMLGTEARVIAQRCG